MRRALQEHGPRAASGGAGGGDDALRVACHAAEHGSALIGRERPRLQDGRVPMRRTTWRV